ncbi:S-methyl-5-thioribose-1-phosphate isomerase [Deferribacterales bacterium RsTz2092]|nr:methylthioribose-1-phosphate isomerase 1 [Deferribacterales bacterium]
MPDKIAIPRTLYWDDNALTILDQTALPERVSYEKQTGIKQVWESIHALKVRGAPAIGVAAAYGALTGLFANLALPVNEFRELFIEQANYINTSRPTAVNLSRSINIMATLAKSSKATSAKQLYDELVACAKTIHNEDIEMCRKIGEVGAPLIKDNCTIHTHCNAGALATSGIGTALAPMYVAHENGIKFKVYADETRPLLQGGRLTAWELHQSGIDVALICDNMVADVFSRGKVNLSIVGCDRVAANGDTANKIGTLGVAIIAKRYNVPFYVACPSSTIDFNIASGAEIPIEERDGHEISKLFNTYNPAFDVTPNELITGFITEKGTIMPPFAVNLKLLRH